MRNDSTSTITQITRLSALSYPNEYSSTFKCNHDTDLYYTGYSYTNLLPSPFLTSNHNKNAIFTNTTSYPDLNLNPLQYFDREFHDKIMSARGYKDYSTWLPDLSNGNDCPAASLCDMYSIEGAKRGSWWLPTLSEAIYIGCKSNKTLYNSRNTIYSVFGSVQSIKGRYPKIWTSVAGENSTNSNNTYVYTVTMDRIDYINYNSEIGVMAFTKILSE